MIPAWNALVASSTLVLGVAAPVCVAAAAGPGAIQGQYDMARPPTPMLASVMPPGSPREGGRIRWSYQMDGPKTLQFLEVAPQGAPNAGTVYCSDGFGLYALDPAGQLLWFSGNSGGGNPISVGPDGTIYTGMKQSLALAGRVQALNPDGSLKWEYIPPPTPSPLFLGAGPNVGPDGNIYAVQDPSGGEGLGVFSLDPSGNLRWSNPTSLELYLVTDPYRSEIVFAPDRLYTGVVNGASGGSPVVFAIDYQGQELWNTSFLNIFFGSYPRVDPLGRAIGIWGQTGVIAVEPGGATAWTKVSPGQLNVTLPSVDSTGLIYSGAQNGQMWSLDPTGAIRWVLPKKFDWFYRNIGVSPNDQMIVAHLGRSDLPTSITGHDSADGSTEWMVDIPDIDGYIAWVSSPYPRFSSDSSTVYVAVSSVSPAVKLSRVYAIDTGLGACQADCDASGTLDIDDFVCFQTLYAIGNLQADCDQSGGLDIDDFICFQTLFALGC